MLKADDFPLIPVADALAIVLREAQPLPAKRIALERAAGFVLAEAVRTQEPLPPFVASIKDGYAVVAADGRGDFPVVGNAVAGRMGDFTLARGQVAYITTGAPLPPGADAVVQVEDTERLGDRGGMRWVAIRRAVRAGEDVRPIGFDIAAGEEVLHAGVRLGPAEVGLAATAGASSVRVHGRPRVGVLSTGDELAAGGAALRPGAIRDSNGPTLRAAVKTAGGLAVDLGVARDNEAELRSALARGLATCDVLVTTGGVSMGELDYVKQVASEFGVVHFGRLLMKPGKPCTFATALAGQQRSARKRLLFALPGNPVSGLVTFYLLVLPAIRKMAGWSEPSLRRVQATLDAPVRLDPTRPEYHRAVLVWDTSMHGGAGGYVARSTGMQASSRLLSMRGANALLELPQGEGSLAAGSVVTAMLIG